MKTSRLYRRIYTYIALSVALSVLLTSGLLQFLFFRDNNNRKAHFMEEQASIVLYLIHQMDNHQTPEVLQDRISQLANDLQWEIQYIPSPLPESYKQYIADLQRRPVHFVDKEDSARALVLGALKPESPEAGLLTFSIPEPRFGEHGRSPFLSGPPGKRPGPPPGPPRGLPPHILTPLMLVGALLLMLGLFLIPLVRYLIRPLRTLSEALHKVSNGDFSQLSKMDPEFQPMVEAFNHMTTEVQAMLKEKQRLIADVSHELRSPLARMRVSMELLSKEGRGKAKYIERAIYEIEELDHLINDLLDVSALELNTAQIPLEQIDVLQWVNTSLDHHQLWFEQHNIRVNRYFDLQSKKIHIEGRQHLLDRVLNNLLSNLVKHAPSDSDVDISIRSEGESVILKVRDRGPGVPSEAIAKLTEPFYRVDTSRTRKTGGTGLGLAIVQKIMLLHHGEVSFTTPEDGEGGLEVVLEFPSIERFRKTGPLSSGSGSGPLK
jgi:signal transduction histidine kinase